MRAHVVREPWRAHPLAWIHRAEARSIAAEISATLSILGEALPERPLLRLSDPVMLATTATLSTGAVPYIGPGAAPLARCYDKLEAARIADAHGINTPGASTSYPAIVKPRRGSDSIGVKLMHRGPIPRDEELIVQEHIRGEELTIAAIGDRVGVPLRIELPVGTPYSFLRKYCWRSSRAPVESIGLIERVQEATRTLTGALGVDWAARVDFILEEGTGRLVLLECDAAPLVGKDSAWAASLSAAGIARGEQLGLLLK